MRVSAHLAAGAAALALIVAGGVASPAAAGVPVRAASAKTGICAGPAKWHGMAARLSRNIRGALAGRSGSYAVTVYDRVTGITCQLNGAEHFDSASVVKVVILAALLRWHQQTGRPLSDDEKDLATLMITQSDNDAATALWDELGRDRIQDFLDAAGMTHTQLGPGDYWGLSQITAHDQLKLLRLLTRSGRVLDHHSREYELDLMAEVIPAQRWGVTAGAPRGVTSHVKNGWLPDYSGWHINSIGAFTGGGRDYMMAVLSDGDPTMAYGVATIEAVARVVHRDLAAATTPVLATATAAVTVDADPSPYATVPALPPYPRSCPGGGCP
jgi:beta-lactamase class A